MYFIDTHTHIYLPEFDGDRPEMIQRAEEAGVRIFLLPAIDSSTHEKMIELEKNFPSCRSMIGLHPCSANPGFEQELATVKEYLSKRSFVAIGEIGLDFYWDKTYTEQQYAAFHAQIRLALEAGLPIVIHSRNAIDECIEVVRQYPGIRGVFHCFSGNEEQAQKILDLGFYLGIGGVLTFKNIGLDKVVAKTGLDSLILETDAPYLAPVPYRGKRNEPAYIPLIASTLATVCNRTPEGVSEITSKNAKNLFNL